ncbi:MAG TPA: exodeoxyribonuclease VII large subunit [Bdellovibrionota bacterium]|nr:exodeoxyribonuclease VII large subunit [Bdellovibrionota bacterium]
MDLQGLPLFDLPVAPAKPKTWTVTELTSAIRGTLEPQFTQVWIQGEISNCRPASSGHLYFSLKDSGATIAAAAFGWSRRQGPRFEPRDGMEVLARGRVTVYAPRGSYQLTVDHIEPLGAGALQAAFEQLKSRLQAEGLFDSTKKRKLPRFPRRVAVVTSPSGAAIQDMLNILGRRAPQMRVTVIPARVQGDGAAEEVLRGLELANRHSLGDVVVLARGGGSMEDLWSFNDERLARAIRASQLPVVSAVGHEIDFTISDFASDLRAPTPSAAAEIVSADWVDAPRAVTDLGRRLNDAVKRGLDQRRVLLSHVAARLVNPKDRLREQAQRLDEWTARLEQATRNLLVKRRALLENQMGRLDALSPLRVLERGYALVHAEDEDGAEGRLFRQAHDIGPGQKLQIRFSDGKVAARAVASEAAGQ